MDQEKIGKFISYVRREKGLTQNDLAFKLGITDRAVSKWENGRGMPDLSLIKELCNILDISVNELLSGERLEKKEINNKSEENIIKTLDYTYNKIKKTKNIFGSIVIIIISIFGILSLMFLIDIDRMKNNKEVIFSTWGFSYVPPVDLSTDMMEISILEYLINTSESNKRYENEKSFVAMKTYLVEEVKERSLYYVYSWVLEESYYLDSNEILQESGSSIPYKFIIERNDDNYQVIDYKIPRDGSLYLKDMKTLFPYDVRKEMDEVHTDGTIERLQLEIDYQVELYFKK